MSQGNDRQRAELLKGFSSLSQIGITIIVCVAAGIFIGRALDDRLGTSPWMMLIFIFIGTGAAFKSIIDYAKREQAKDKQQQDKDNIGQLDMYFQQGEFSRRGSQSQQGRQDENSWRDPYNQQDQQDQQDENNWRNPYFQNDDSVQQDKEGQDR